jgi:signal recognition particle GTPase
MFESLTDRLAATVKTLRGQARLTEDNIKDAMRDAHGIAGSGRGFASGQRLY